jgi:hypothetical protein
VVAVYSPVAQGFLGIEMIGRCLGEDRLGDFARRAIE